MSCSVLWFACLRAPKAKDTYTRHAVFFSPRFTFSPFDFEEYLKGLSPSSPVPVSTVGVWPNWPETLAMARRRFAERLLVYISRGAKA